MWEFIAGFLFGSAARGRNDKDRETKRASVGTPAALIVPLVILAGAGISAFSHITLTQAMWSVAAAVGLICALVALKRGLILPAFVMIVSACGFAYTVHFTGIFGSPDQECRQDQITHMPWDQTRDCPNASDSVLDRTAQIEPSRKAAP